MTTCAYIVVYANGSKVPRPRLVYVIVYGGAWRWRRCGGVGGGAGWVGGWAGWWSGGRGVGKWAGGGGRESCYIVRKLLGSTDLYGGRVRTGKGVWDLCVAMHVRAVVGESCVHVLYVLTHTAIRTFAYFRTCTHVLVLYYVRCFHIHLERTNRPPIRIFGKRDHRHVYTHVYMNRQLTRHM